MFKLFAIIAAFTGQTYVLQHEDTFATEAACEVQAVESRATVVEYLKRVYGGIENHTYTLSMKCEPVQEPV